MPELLSPQDAYALFRSSGAFLVDVRTEKEFLKKAIPGCPLLPLETLPDALGPRFAGRPVIFSAVLEGAPAKRPTCCKKARRAAPFRWKAASSRGRRRAFPSGACASFFPAMPRLPVTLRAVWDRTVSL